MHKKSTKFKKLAIYGLWIWIPLIIVEIIYFVFLLPSEQFSEWANTFLYGELYSFIVSAIASFIWIKYLLKSKRVKNTFTK